MIRFCDSSLAGGPPPLSRSFSGGKRTLEAPFQGHAVLDLRKVK
ncbi:MAG: hypothetical protein U0746_09765 [Gemmataceae bacterium]